MARVTVEDCERIESNRFLMVLLATKRTRELIAGASPTVPPNNDKKTVIALREIADQTININTLYDSAIKSFQRRFIHDETDADLEDELADELESEDTEETEETKAAI